MKKYIRVTAILLAAVMLCGILALFTACSNKSDVVLELDGHKITEGMYSYWMHNWKEYYLTYYSDVEDTDEYWSAINDTGVTNEEYLSEQIRTRINFYLVGMVLFDELGLKLSREVKDTVKSNINDQIAHAGSRSAYAKELEIKYGISIGEMKEVFTAESKYTAVLEYLYDETTGRETASADELEAYYQTYYSRIKYVMFLKNVKYVYNDDGTRKTDSTGRYLTEKLTEEEKQQVAQKAEDVYKEALGGANMNDLMKKFMEEFGFDISAVPNGFYISADDYVTHSATVTAAALEMKVDEIRLCENDDCYYIVKKYDLPEKGYASSTDSNQFKNFVSYVNNQKLAEKFSGIAKNIKEITEITAKYDFSEL